MFLVIAIVLIIIAIIAIIVIKAISANKRKKSLLAAAMRGDAQAQYDLAETYQRKDVSEAVSLFKQSAKRGYSLAQLALGLRYKKGNGVEKDFVEAAQWFQKAADQGLADAQYNIGWCYLTGKGVEKDVYRAVKWFEMAAVQNHADAQYKLGRSYMTGCGVDENDDKAIYWFQKAAGNGSESARKIVGFKEIETNEELKNSLGYKEIVKPLQYALVKHGYRLTCSSFKTTFGYTGIIYVYNKSSSGYEWLGEIAFAKGPVNLGSCEYNLKTKNIGCDAPDIHNGKMKYMAIQNGRISVLLYSLIATATNPPDIPGWLMIGARVFMASGYDFIDPKWVYENDYSDYRKYLNVMFRG